ncbi:hypothetical protein CLV59_1133 [Chitinophaga dinghuensis]|uniref:Uncharacterized protein n=1 Tax=Chitinophaga dinghuensis TaxID=1539050 RepID=A0A327VKU6_9BACT|nr:hypothetical protein CLV59_1133 [Chitinophaga dinghuensis]
MSDVNVIMDMPYILNPNSCKSLSHANLHRMMVTNVIRFPVKKGAIGVVNTT